MYGDTSGGFLEESVGKFVGSSPWTWKTVPEEDMAKGQQIIARIYPFPRLHNFYLFESSAGDRGKILGRFTNSTGRSTFMWEDVLQV